MISSNSSPHLASASFHLSSFTTSINLRFLLSQHPLPPWCIYNSEVNPVARPLQPSRFAVYTNQNRSIGLIFSSKASLRNNIPNARESISDRESAFHSLLHRWSNTAYRPHKINREVRIKDAEEDKETRRTCTPPSPTLQGTKTGPTWGLSTGTGTGTCTLKPLRLAEAAAEEAAVRLSSSLTPSRSSSATSPPSSPCTSPSMPAIFLRNPMAILAHPPSTGGAARSSAAGRREEAAVVTPLRRDPADQSPSGNPTTSPSSLMPLLFRKYPRPPQAVAWGHFFYHVKYP